MMRIIEGQPQDVARIMPVMHAAFDAKFGEAWNAAQCTSMLALPYSNLWMAEVDGKICGFAISRGIIDEEELLMIGVDPVWRKRSIGRALIEKVMNNAADNGRLFLFLEVRDGNPAHNFYNNIGFSQIGRRKNYYTGGDGSKYDAITMRFMLTQMSATGTS